MKAKIELRTRWVNGWFLRLFSTPTLIAGSVEYPLSWSAPTEVEIDENRDARIGVGVRYIGRRRLLGVHMTELPRESAPQNGPVVLTFRNGVWNHDPFVLAD